MTAEAGRAKGFRRGQVLANAGRAARQNMRLMCIMSTNDESCELQGSPLAANRDSPSGVRDPHTINAVRCCDRR